MKIRPTKYSEPSDVALFRNGLYRDRLNFQERVRRAAAFDMVALSSIQNIKETAKFFDLGSRAIEKIIKMQRDDLHLEEAFPIEFNNSEDNIVTNGEWQELKDSAIYRRVVNGN